MKKRNAFLLGSLIGAGAALIFAPKSGKELQKDLKEKATDVQTKIKELDVEEVKESFLIRLDEVKALVSEFDWEGPKSELEKRANDIKEKLDTLLENVEETKEQVEDVIETVSEEAEEDFTIVVDTVKESTEDVLEATKEAVDVTKDAAKELVEEVEESLKETK